MEREAMTTSSNLIPQQTNGQLDPSAATLHGIHTHSTCDLDVAQFPTQSIVRPSTARLGKPD